jgi:hypothetical protein
MMRDVVPPPEILAASRPRRDATDTAAPGWRSGAAVLHNTQIRDPLRVDEPGPPARVIDDLHKDVP